MTGDADDAIDAEVAAFSAVLDAMDVLGSATVPLGDDRTRAPSLLLTRWREHFDPEHAPAECAALALWICGHLSADQILRFDRLLSACLRAAREQPAPETDVRPRGRRGRRRRE